MPDQLESALGQVGRDWDEMSQLPAFKSMNPDDQSKVRHQYYMDNVVTHPVIKAALPKDHTLGPRLQDAFFGQESQEMEQRAAPGNRPLWDQPLSRGLGLNADDIDVDKHQILHGVAHLAEGLTTPKNAAIIGGAALASPIVGAGLIGAGISASTVPVVTAGVQGLMDAGFTLDMLHGIFKEVPEAWAHFNYAQQLEQAGRILESEHAYHQLESELVQMGGATLFASMAAKGAKEHLEFTADWVKLPTDLRESAIRGGMDPLHPDKKGFAIANARDAAAADPGPGHPAFESAKTQAAKTSGSPDEQYQQAKVIARNESGQWYQENLRRRAVGEPDIGFNDWKRRQAPISPIPTSVRPPEAAARPEQAATPPRAIQGEVLPPQNERAELEGTYLKRPLITLPNGETMVQPRIPGPDAETMKSRSLTRFDQAMSAGHTDEALGHLKTWGQYATPEEFKAKLESYEAPLRQHFEDFKLVRMEQARRAADKAGVPASTFPRVEGGDAALIELGRKYGRRGTGDLNNLPTDKALGSMAKTILNKLNGQKDLVQALVGGKQGTTALLQEIEAAKGVKLGELGRAQRKVYESPTGVMAEHQPVAAPEAKAAKIEMTRENVGDRPFNSAGRAMKTGRELFGAGKFMVREKQGKFYVKAAESSEVPASAEVGRTPETSARSVSRSESVQASQPSARPGEPVRPAEGSEVAPPAPRSVRGAKDVLMARMKTIHADNPAMSLPDVKAKAEAEMKKEAGVFRLGGEGDPGARREAKVNDWISKLKDPNSTPEIRDGAFKMLKAYGLSQDEILQRLTGAEGFAETSNVDPRTGIPEASQEGLEERMGGINEAESAVDKVMGKYTSPGVPGALVEGLKTGEADVKGVKSPATEELERMVKLPDPRGEKTVGMGAPKSSELFEARIADLMARHPDMDRRMAEDMAREWLDNQRGSLSLKSLRKVVLGNNPESTVPARLLKALDDVIHETDVSVYAKGVLREVGGTRARTIDQLVDQFRDAEKAHDGNQDFQDIINFNNAGEHKPGATFLHPQDQAVANSMHGIWNDFWDQLKAVRPDKFSGAGIDNYLGRLMKPGRGQQIAQSIFDARRPFEGRKGFTHTRINDWIDESIANGAEPITKNPITMQLMAMDQVVKYISANRAFNEFKGSGVADWVQRGSRPPAGWMKIDDAIFQPNSAHGAYWAHPDVAKIFNRFLQPGLRGNVYYDALRSLGDTQNMMQLGWSAFHGTFTTVAGAMTSDLALGIQKLFKGDFGGAIKSGFDVVQPWKTAQYGGLMNEEWLAPGTHTWLSQAANLMEQAGGRAKGSSLQDRSRIASFKEEAPSFMKMAKALPAFAEWSSKWLMENYVPKIKAGIFAKAAMDRYGDMLGRGATPIEIRTEMGKIWDSVDNRAGLMVYDNRFWNRTVKDVMQLSIRSTGWNWGTLQELGGGTMDIGKFALNKLQGRQAELSSRAAYTMALPIMAGTIGAMIGYAAGQPPQKLEDYFFPKTGGTDASGQASRLALPTYMRDVFAYAESPASTFIHKIHPMFQDLAELYSNQDFYGTEIRQEGAPFLDQVGDVVKYIAKQGVPIGFQASAKRWADAETPADKIKAVLESEAGFTPAPKYIGETRAEETAYLLDKRHRMAGPKTQANFEHYQLLTRFEHQWDKGTLKTDELSQAYRAGKITDQDIDKLFAERELTPFQRNFKGLEVDEAFRVMREATKEERSQLYPILEDKYFNRYDSLPQEDQAHYGDLLRGYMP